MPTFSSRQLIADLSKQTEDILNTAITQWQMYPPDRMLFKQRADAWSAAQCLMHLNSYGRFYIPAIQNSIVEAERKGFGAKETFTASFIGDWFTNLMMPKGDTGAIKKMKSPKEHTPDSNENSDAVLAEFIEQQETILKLLERAQTIDLKKAKTPISISRFIRLPLGDTFRFLVAHIYRHVLQAERAIAAATENKITA